ncbi:ATP-binding cassette domain-containing protein, partial [Lactococcus lactis]|uniref:ATP-binding cassette domain-containing protein n=1 Tax=Lactococcus lactis TaxID=1358 RepID=UPI003075BD95
MDKGGGVKLEIQNLSKRIDGNVVLKHINLFIPMGSIFGIVGRNGSGKTTLFRTIA